MTKEEVLEVVTDIGKSYRVKSKWLAEPFVLVVSTIGNGGLIQESGDGLDFRYVNFYEIESIEKE